MSKGGVSAKLETYVWDTVNAGWSLPERLGDHEAVAELIGLFKQDLASRLQVLRGAVLRGDLSVTGAQARAIEGSAIQMGAMNLVTLHHLRGNLEERAACPVRSL